MTNHPDAVDCCEEECTGETKALSDYERGLCKGYAAGLGASLAKDAKTPSDGEFPPEWKMGEELSELIDLCKSKAVVLQLKRLLPSHRTLQKGSCQIVNAKTGLGEAIRAALNYLKEAP